MTAITTSRSLYLEFGPVELPSGVPDSWGGVSSDQGCLGYIAPEVAEAFNAQSARVAELEAVMAELLRDHRLTEYGETIVRAHLTARELPGNTNTEETAKSAAPSGFSPMLRSDILSRAAFIDEQLDELVESANDNSPEFQMRVAAVRESANHLGRGAVDPTCPDCGATPPPTEGYTYDTDDGCPVCGSDEYALFTWASSLEGAVADLWEYVNENHEFTDEVDEISGEVANLISRNNGIEGTIRIVREEK